MLKKGLETSYEDSNRCKHSKPANQNANPKCKGIGELTLLDFLEQAEGKKSESCRQADCTGRRRNIKIHYFNIRWLWCSNSESGRECIVKYRCRLGIRNDSGRTYKKR